MLEMTDARPLCPQLFSHSCAISRSSKLELLESLSEFGRLVVLIAQIGIDAACCLGRSYAGGRMHQPLLPPSTASTRFSSIISQHICFGNVYRTGTVLAADVSDVRWNGVQKSW